MFSSPYRMLHRPNRSILFRDVKISYAEKLVGMVQNKPRRHTISLHFQSSGHHCFPNTTLLVPIVSKPSAPYLDAPTVRLAARDATTAAALMPSWSKQASAVVARLSRHLGGRAGELVKPQHPCVGSDVDHVTMLPVAKGDVGVANQCTNTSEWALVLCVEDCHAADICAQRQPSCFW